jgi:hypothetical protein
MGERTREQIVYEWLKKHSNNKIIREAIAAEWEPPELEDAVSWWKERLMCDPEENIEEVIDDLLEALSVVRTVRKVESYYEMEAENHLMIVRNSEEESEDDVIGTVAVFMNKEPVRSASRDRMFSRLVDIHKEDKTIKEVLVREGVGNVLHDWNLTFKIPEELAVDVYCWAGYPLVTKELGRAEVSQGHILTHTIIGFIMPINKELAAALKIIDLNRFWLAPEGIVWREKEAEDFSCHIQALCEDHAVDLPVPLE